MPISSAVAADLAHLVGVLQLSPGDLQDALRALKRDLVALVPSFAGLSLTVVVQQQPVTLTDLVQRALPAPVRSSLAFQLEPLVEDARGGLIVFYAWGPGALAALAFGLSEIDAVARPDMLVDRHLSPPGRSGITGVEELSLVNRAVGLLVGRGRTPADARQHLQVTARDSNLEESQVAAYLVSMTE